MMDAIELATVELGPSKISQAQAKEGHLRRVELVKN